MRVSMSMSVGVGVGRGVSMSVGRGADRGMSKEWARPSAAIGLDAVDCDGSGFQRLT